MTAFIGLGPAWRALFLAAILMLCFLALYCIVSAAVLRMKPGWTALCVGLFSLEYLMLQPMFDITYHKYFGSQPSEFMAVLGGLPVVLLLLAIVALTVATVYVIIKIRIWKHTHLSLMSIKGSVDLLPTGLCFYSENGTVLLANLRMEKLCNNITGNALMDAGAFWDVLETGQGIDAAVVISVEPNPVLKLPDGCVWSFERRTLKTELGSVLQITATDITQAYNVGLELENQVHRLQKMNDRLRRYSKMVCAVVREEEVLAAKISIHDKLGRALITTRRYIENRNERQPEELLQLWKHTVALLRRENKTDQLADPLWEIEYAAKLAGVQIRICGDLPKDDNSALRVMKAAALESLNNAVRHAGATELTVTVYQIVTHYIFAFSNNGVPAAGPIIEGGGLTGLRRRVRQAQGQMHIQSVPCFVLKISIPREEHFDDDECIDR